MVQGIPGRPTNFFPIKDEAELFVAAREGVFRGATAEGSVAPVQQKSPRIALVDHLIDLTEQRCDFQCIRWRVGGRWNNEISCAEHVAPFALVVADHAQSVEVGLKAQRCSLNTYERLVVLGGEQVVAAKILDTGLCPLGAEQSCNCMFVGYVVGGETQFLLPG